MLRIAPILLLIATPAAAQSADSQLWLTASASGDVGPVRIAADTTLRIGDAADGVYEWSRGGFAGIEAGGVQIAGGYQRVTAYRDGRVSRTEDRLREQASFTIAGPVTGRVRLEQRFRSDGDDTGWRLRVQLRVTQPLGAVRLVGWHESFAELNHTDWGQVPGYRRMRNFAGVEMPLAPRLTAQAGYLNQYDFAARDAVAHVALMGIGASF